MRKTGRGRRVHNGDGSPGLQQALRDTQPNHTPANHDSALHTCGILIVR